MSKKSKVTVHIVPGAKSLVEAKNALKSKSKLKFKTGDWVVVNWKDSPDEIGYVVDRKPTKKAKYSEIIFLRGKQSCCVAVNHEIIVAVAPSIELAGFDMMIPRTVEAIRDGDPMAVIAFDRK